MQYVSGLIYNGEDDFFRGSLGFEDGLIKEISDKEERRAIARGLIIPSFFDAHVHIGDSIVREEVRGSVEEIFGPKGIKAQRLSSVEEKNMVDSIQASLRNMLSSGVSGFCDFREGGLKGLSSLYNALFSYPIRCIALGRPEENRFEGNELEAILKTADGIGASAISDWDYDMLKQVSQFTRSKGKLFALHASEAVREDIDKVLELKPDFLVHMTVAEDKDLELCAERKIPVVVCPRNNAFFGRMIDIPRMLEKGVQVMLGTDNVMLNAPSVLRELEFAYRISRTHGGRSCKEIFKLGMNARRFFLKEDRFERGQKTDFMVLENLGALEQLEKDPWYHIVLRSTESNIVLVCVGEHLHLKGKY
jgi:cytosine/adenosine deaminase-related metal-dependent hydrolase